MDGTLSMNTNLVPTHSSMPLASPHDSQSVQASTAQHVTATTVISWILQGGVIASSALIVLGLCLLPTRPGGLSVQRVLTFPHTITDIWAGLLILRPQAIIVVGLLLLIATPVVRVAVSIVAFALEHDRRYVVITLVVLAILLLSFLLGKGGA